MGEVLAVLILMAAIATGGVLVMRRLRPAQRTVVAFGLLAAAVQVYIPPCLGPGLPPDYAPAPIGHRFFHASSYDPSDSGIWIDGHKLTMDLLITAVMTVIGCALVAAWRRPTGQQLVQQDPPAH